MSRVKPIAAGFVQDAKKLLDEFVSTKSPDFSDFSHIWRKHNFQAIFMGRSLKELVQFTQEIYQITLKILETSELFYQIGAVYLLHSLFLSQPIEERVRIRITLKQYQHFLDLKEVAVKERYKTLYYIISCLTERGCLDYVAHATLLGPVNSKSKTEVNEMPLELHSMIQNLKDSSKSLLDDDAWKELEELSDSYEKLRKEVASYAPMETFSDIKEDLNRIKEKFQLLLAGGNGSGENSESDKEQDNIGSRRAQIKSNAFASKASFRHLNPTDEDIDEDNERLTRSKAQRKSLVEREPNEEATKAEGVAESAEKGAEPKRREKPHKPKRQRKSGKSNKEQKELEQLEAVVMGIEDFSKGTKLKGIKKHGPVARSSYLDYFPVEPLEELKDKFTLLQHTSDFYDSDEDIDDPDEDIDDPDEDIDDLDEMKMKENHDESSS